MGQQVNPRGLESIVLFFARALVDKSSHVSVKREGEVFTIKTTPDNIGRLVGRAGKHIRAIRTLVRAAGGSGNSRGGFGRRGKGEGYSVEIAE